jgi:Flp pilus assembly protein TadD
MACIGPIAAISAAATRLVERRAENRSKAIVHTQSNRKSPIDAPPTTLSLRSPLTWAATIVVAALSIASIRHEADFVDSPTLWTNTAEKNPGSSITLSNYGSILFGKGDLAGAEAQYRRAAELDRSNDGAYTGLAFVAERRHDLREAERLHRIAINLQPDYARAKTEQIVHLAQLLMQMDDLPAATSEYRRAVLIAPRDPGLHNNLGSLLLRQGHRSEAAEEFRAAIQCDPQWAPAHLNLAGIALVDGNLQLVQLHCQAVLAEHPDDPNAIELLRAAAQQSQNPSSPLNSGNQ